LEELLDKNNGGNAMKNPIKNEIGAVFIPVSDIEKARDWYCDVLGLPLDGEIFHGHIYVLPMKVNTDNIEESFQYLKGKQVEIVSDIQHGHYFNVKDPDGNLLMICKC
jgi:catechol 2,3-dioxygenase-like lactoylglutathione lyase family enzyme